MKYLSFFRLLPVLLLVAVAFSGRAQNPTTGGPTPGAVLPDPAAVPIDGGASLLLAGGVAYGVRYLRQRRRTA